MALTTKQQRFVDEYLVDGNATKAAERAGYSAKTAYSQGSRLLKHVEVNAEIEARQAALAEALGITHERVRDELAKLAFASMGDYMKVDPDTGQPRLDFASLTDGQKAALIEVVVDTLGGSREVPPVTRTRFKLADKRAALMDLAKLCGLIRDSDGKDDTNVQIAKIERVIVHHEPRREYMDDAGNVIDHA